jgi:RNA polymerase sigma-70 factor, ECF subfamily
MRPSPNISPVSDFRTPIFPSIATFAPIVHCTRVELQSSEAPGEQTLIERAKEDPQAFGNLFDRSYPAIFAYVLRRVGKWNDAQDITSEVFLKALKGLWRFRWQGIAFSAWLYRIATNEVGIYFRRAGRAPVSLNQLIEQSGFEPASRDDLIAEKLEAERQFERHRDFLVARSKIASLPLKYQHVISLRFFEDMSVKEIAAVLGKKDGTVKSLLSRGLRRLRRLM